MNLSFWNIKLSITQTLEYAKHTLTYNNNNNTKKI